MNGSIVSMSRHTYDLTSRANWSSLKHMAKSPAHYHHNLFNAQEDSDAKKRGRVTHLATFEPERFLRETAVWDGGVRRGKAWDAFCKANEGLELLTQSERELCLAVAKAARTDAVAAKYITHGRAEQTLLWVDKDTGIECKGRVDFLADVKAIVDLKGVKSAHPAEFAKAVVNYDHLGQAAFYTDGFKTATGEDWPYVFVAVENSAPHVVQVYTVTSRQIQMGRDAYRSHLFQLAECRRTNSWPGYATAEMELVLPRWADPEGEPEGESLDDMDLNITQGAA